MLGMALGAVLARVRATPLAGNHYSIHCFQRHQQKIESGKNLCSYMCYTFDENDLTTFNKNKQ